MLFLPPQILHSNSFSLIQFSRIPCFQARSQSSFRSVTLVIMSSFGKEPDPSKGGAGGAQKDCDACGNRDHVVKQASKGGDRDKTKHNASDVSGAAQAVADRARGKDGGVLGPIGENSAWITDKEKSAWQKLQRLHRLQRLA